MLTARYIIDQCSKSRIKYGLFVWFWLSSVIVSEAQRNPRPLVQHVNPFIGTAGHGHTYPGATLPLSMVQLSPDTGVEGWDWCSGYNYADSSIIGFSHTHLSGTGVADFGDILIMPMVGKPKIIPGFKEDPDSGYRSRFSHDQEWATPGYYKVRLQDYDITAELTTTKRTGFHRYTFPETSEAHFILDLQHGLDPARFYWFEDRLPEHVTSAEVEIVNDTLITGKRISNGWAKEQHIYFALAFSKPMDNAIIIANDHLHAMKKAVGTNLKVLTDFKTSLNEEVMVKVGISAVSKENAMENLQKENPHWDFDKVKEEANETWHKEFSKIRIEASEKDKELFYTALYHASLAPNLFSDSNSSYRGMDGKTHKATDFDKYTTFSLWDTYRGLHPLTTIISPSVVNDFVHSMMSYYEQFGSLPIYPLVSNETYTMSGYHSVPVIVDAIFKGLTDVDEEKALEAMIATSRKDVLGIPFLEQYGYIPNDKERFSSSRTLEFAFDDYAIALLAKRLNKDSTYQHYLNRSKNYKNLFDSDKGFFRGKNSDGTWAEVNFDPTIAKRGWYHFQEGNAWQYLWSVLHDIPGLSDLIGGAEVMDKKLDDFFTTETTASEAAPDDVSGLIGQYAHGNEPSHHVAYLYNYIGKPWKSQEMVAKIVREMYKNTPDGIVGNEDCGQMSAWYVFSTLGFYSVNPIDGRYMIGTPKFKKATLEVQGRKAFTIESVGVSDRNIYIQSAKLNGKKLDRSWITHEEIIQGGELKFVMGPSPNKKWGANLIR